jgi:hypothetical protein
MSAIGSLDDIEAVLRSGQKFAFRVDEPLYLIFHGCHGYADEAGIAPAAPGPWWAVNPNVPMEHMGCGYVSGADKFDESQYGSHGLLYVALVSKKDLEGVTRHDDVSTEKGSAVQFSPDHLPKNSRIATLDEVKGIIAGLAGIGDTIADSSGDSWMLPKDSPGFRRYTRLSNQWMSYQLGSRIFSDRYG